MPNFLLNGFNIELFSFIDFLYYIFQVFLNLLSCNTSRLTRIMFVDPFLQDIELNIQDDVGWSEKVDVNTLFLVTVLNRTITILIYLSLLDYHLDLFQ